MTPHERNSVLEEAARCVENLGEPHYFQFSARMVRELKREESVEEAMRASSELRENYVMFTDPPEDEHEDLRDPKWMCLPDVKSEADKVLLGKRCPACNSPYLLPLKRLPVPDWKAHCNSCGSEFLIAVILNRDAWQFRGATIGF